MRTKKPKDPQDAKYAHSPLAKALAVRLKQWRHDEGLTFKAMSAKMGVSITVICDWEHANRFPDVMNLWALAQFTGISASEFIQPLKTAGAKKAKGR